MKRSVSLILIMMMVCLMSFGACAEKVIPEINQKFSIRSGIGFQHDKSAVQKAEKFGELKEDGTVFVMPAMLGDIYDVRLTYYFDSADKLASFHYFTPSDAYTTLKNQLENKYGSSLYHNELSPLKTSAWEEVEYDWNSYTYSVSPRILTFDVNACDCWFVKFSDCYVVIELLGIKASDYQFTSLGYMPISNTKMESVLENLRLRDENVKNSYNNDL